MRVGVIGVTTPETVSITKPAATAGLCFKDPAEAILHYYESLSGAADVMIVLSHNGYADGGYGYGLPIYGDQTLANRLNQSGKPVHLIIGGHSHTDPSRQTTTSGSVEYLPTIVAGPGNTPVAVAQAYRYNTYLGEVVLGFKPKPGGGFQVVSRTGRYLAVSSGTPEDVDIVNLGAPYRSRLDGYLVQAIGQTSVPLDALKGFTEETNGANLEADASMDKLRWLGTAVDFHLSGALANRQVAAAASSASPVTLTVADAFTLMPSEYSLVVVRVNGPQLKAILERSYRNYYYYKYIPGYGGYTYSSACMLDISRGGRIVYRDTYPNLPNGNNVLGLFFQDTGGQEHRVDFNDATATYRVSTLDYLAAGGCNFNDNGRLSAFDPDRAGYFLLPARRGHRLPQGPARTDRAGSRKPPSIPSSHKFSHLPANNHALNGQTERNSKRIAGSARG